MRRLHGSGGWGERQFVPFPAFEVDGKTVTTIEGLVGEGNQLDPIQEAFVENGGVQCGFCTPGMIMSAKALLKRNATSHGRRDSKRDFRKSLPLHRICADCGVHQAGIRSPCSQ
jgi:aerobic-type carbon monoxide dehydrogenase small subunit (CoxS/CutS family)